MTDREKAIVMAYTGYCMLAGDKLKVFYEYVGELLGRPVYTHEFADPDIREKATNDFYKLCRETTPDKVIHCKDCIHHKLFMPCEDWRQEYICDVFDWKSKDDDFCSFAERRNDEHTD